MTGPLTGLADQYPYIILYGQFMDSSGYYINNELERAKSENAPHNAVFKRDDGSWFVMTDYDATSPFAVYAAERGYKWQED